MGRHFRQMGIHPGRDDGNLLAAAPDPADLLHYQTVPFFQGQ